MRDDRSRLNDILEAIDLIILFAQGRTREDLTTDRLLQSALLHQLYVIGEAARRISENIKDRHADVPWRVIYGFRNHIAHEYFSLDLDIVWQTETDDVPKLKARMSEIVRSFS
jgi:uncharacterized protein with HEPN domain